MILEVDPNFPQPGIIEHALEIIDENHGVLVYPTDTIYGLGCNIFDKLAVDKITKIKGRTEGKNYSIVVSDLKMLKQYTIVNASQEKILIKYLPGAYTFILKASKKLPRYLISKEGTIGVRIPRNRLSVELVKALKKPIISTSFNESGKDPINDPSKAVKSLQNKVDVILDAGEIGNIGSTVVDLTSKKPIIIRQGLGKFDS